MFASSEEERTENVRQRLDKKREERTSSTSPVG